MGNGNKKIDLNFVNRIKYESLEQIGDSLFKDVYEQADQILMDVITSEIGSENEDFENRNTPFTLEKDEHITNTVSFLGERGRGKTSAMMSFLSCLNKLQKQETKWSKVGKYEQPVRFITLPCIDAAMLEKNEFLIDVILAEMWDLFEEYTKQRYLFQNADTEHLERCIKESFVNVRKSYLVLKEKEKGGQKTDRNVPVANELHELAVSMNLRKDIECLVENYIKIFSYDQWKKNEKTFLVLSIDDLDMSGEKALRILEQMRRFLRMPRVIIFLTADIERLKTVCELRYKDIYEQDRDRQRLVNDYLEKVLPYNMRIYMPELKELQDELQLVSKRLKFEDLKLVSPQEKEIILGILAKDCDIYFDGCGQNRHFLQNESLRSMVNYFGQLARMRNTDFTEWLKIDLRERLVERIEDEDQKRFIQNLLTRNYEDVNAAVLDFINKKLNKNLDKDSDKNANKRLTLDNDVSLGRILYGCSKLGEESLDNREFVNCILLFYSIVIKQTNAQMRRTLIGDSIFGEKEYNFFLEVEEASNIVKGFENRAMLSLSISEKTREILKEKEVSKAFKNILKENRGKICAWLYALLYVDIMVPDNGEIVFLIEAKPTKEADGTEETKEANEDLKELQIKPQTKAKKSFFGFLYRSQKEYKSVMERMCKGAIDALKCKLCELSKAENNSMESDKTDADVEQIVAALNTGWDVKTEKKSPETMFPMHNIEILYDIFRTLENVNITYDNTPESYFKIIKSLYQKVADELKRRDDYYQSNIGIEANLMNNFTNILQVKLFLNPDSIPDDGIRTEFVKEFYLLCREVVSFKEPAQ